MDAHVAHNCEHEEVPDERMVGKISQRAETVYLAQQQQNSEFVKHFKLV